ncbi:MAG: hypothetical protein AB1746_11585, partial [Candidatus Zixiibacteriota bacterium]
MKSDRLTTAVFLAILILTIGGFALADDPCPPPELFFPGDNTYRYGTGDGQYEWYDVASALYYEIEVYDILLDTMVDTSDLGDLYDYAFLDTTYYDGDSLYVIYYDNVYYWCSYYWRVRSACDSIGWGDWSDFFHFKVYSKKPHLEYPENGAEYYYYQTIPIGWDFRPGETNFRVQVDNNSDFSSLEIDTVITNQSWTLPSGFSLGSHYWRVSHFYPVIWSDTNYFRIVEAPITSCPVLFSYDGNDFVEENPLLTACENSNYTKVVTDYYHVKGTASPQNDNIIFQLRELENEITYLNNIELITVDHPQGTRVGCSVDGQVFIYEESVAPLAAVDQDGRDCLELIKDKDETCFTADKSGHLILTFPRYGGSYLTFKGPIKLPCPYEEKAASAITTSFNIEIMSENGEWVEMPDVPSRQYMSDEYILADIPSDNSSSEIMVRISWEGGLTADVFSLDVPSDAAPVTQNWPVARYNMLGGSAAKSWPGFGYNEILEMNKGDILEFGFNVESELPEGMSRDYIIKSVGRYQPDYSVFTHLIPGQFQLYSNRPNPFNPSTIVSYDLPQAVSVRLEVYNTLGQHVKTLVNETQTAGHYDVV